MDPSYRPTIFCGIRRLIETEPGLWRVFQSVKPARRRKFMGTPRDIKRKSERISRWLQVGLNRGTAMSLR